MFIDSVPKNNVNIPNSYVDYNKEYNPEKYTKYDCKFYLV